MKNYKKYLFLFFFSYTFNVYSQNIDPLTLSQLNPDQLEIVKKAYSDKYSMDEPVDDLITLDQTLIKKESNEGTDKISIKKYGYNFFSSMPTSLTAVGDLPLPSDYKISLRDQFRVILSGSKDDIFDLNVKLDGTILFPELGAISVVGLSFQELKDKLSLLIQKSYIGVNIDISIQNLSAKKITIVGAVETPGTYLVNPFSTITSALAYSGGISEIGSLRDIKLIRNNSEVFSFDLYDLLIRGDRSEDITIEAGDTILINAASQFVKITGAVKRPAIYEILEGETLEDIVNFALGFNRTANKSKISVQFLDLNETKITKRNTDNLNESLENVMSINVFNYLNQNTANIEVIGAVEQPGFYDVKKYKSLEDLIATLKFVNAYSWLGVLEQFDEKRLLKSTILFNLNDPSTYSNIELLPNSKVFFADINERQFSGINELTIKKITDYELTLNHKQGTFKMPVYGKFNVQSFIDLLGLDMSDVDDSATYVSPIDNLVKTDLYKNMEYIAKKYNTISFRSPDNDLISVSIRGAVEFPGKYILNHNSTIKDLYQLAGSFKEQAFLEGIILTRDKIRERQIKSIQKVNEDLNKALLNSNIEGVNSVDLNNIRSLSEGIDYENLGRLAGNFSPKGSSAKNLILQDGDEIIVPIIPNDIYVLGEVLNPIAFEYSENVDVNSAIKMAGGFQQFADKRRVYVINSNGIVKKANRFLIGNIRIQPGDTIVVPRKLSNSNAIEHLIPLTKTLSDLAFSAAALESLSNN